jgi:hypothetical protein
MRLVTAKSHRWLRVLVSTTCHRPKSSVAPDKEATIANCQLGPSGRRPRGTSCDGRCVVFSMPRDTKGRRFPDFGS